MSNFNEPDYVKTLLKDLNRVWLLLRSNFPNQTVVGGMELICGAGFNLEKAESAAWVAWITDPVHPSGHSFAKMALNLLEAMAPTGKTTAPFGRKRKRDESASGDAGDGGGSENRSKERARAWSATGRGTSYQPTPRGNNRQYSHQQPARAGVTAACISSPIRVEIISALNRFPTLHEQVLLRIDSYDFIYAIVIVILLFKKKS
jgi:hypothetical protein